MFSMCGILCRFLRGWRQSEAAGVMTHAAALSDASLIVEGIVSPSTNIQTLENSSHSLFCQPFCEAHDVSKHHLLWRDNNKQATLIYPKEKVDLMRWTLFIATSPVCKDDDPKHSFIGSSIKSCPNSASGTPMNSAAPSRRSSAFTTMSSANESIITVLLEASYRDKDEESLYGYDVMVEHLAEPYAWKARDVFGVIIRTTPSKLVSMIHAFFNNALVIDDDLCIRKIITVDLIGEPSILCDPSTISDSITPGPWTNAKDNLSELELARSVSVASPGISLPKVTIEAESSNPETTKNQEVSENSLLLQAAKVSSQSSEEDGSSFESETTPLQINQFCPRGWAISGLKSCHRSSQRVVTGQPMTFSSTATSSYNKKENVTPNHTSITMNPFDNLLSNKQNQLRNDKADAESNFSDLNESRDKKVTFDLSPEFRQMFSPDRSKLLRKNPNIPTLFRQTASFHGNENFHQKHNLFGQVDPSIPPLKMNSEADLLKSASIIRDNLANIIENYLTKSSEEQKMTHPEIEPVSDHSTLSSIDEELKADNLYLDQKSPMEVVMPEGWYIKENLPIFSNQETVGLTGLKICDPIKEIDKETSSQSASSTGKSSSPVKMSAKGKQSKLHRQDSTESDVGDFSFSEDSLNEKVSRKKDKSSSYESQYLRSNLDSQPSSSSQKEEHLYLKNKFRGILESNGSLSDDSLNPKKQSLSKLSENDYSARTEKEFDISTDSLERRDDNFSCLSSPDGAASQLCGKSFSEDSLSGGETKVSCLSEDNRSQQGACSSLSSPEDFSLKSDNVETSSSEIPLHWHEEFEKMFTNVNQTMSKDTNEPLALQVNPLEPIKEQDTVSKESCSPIDFSESSSSRIKREVSNSMDNVSLSLSEDKLSISEEVIDNQVLSCAEIQDQNIIVNVQDEDGLIGCQQSPNLDKHSHNATTVVSLCDSRKNSIETIINDESMNLSGLKEYAVLNTNSNSTTEKNIVPPLKELCITDLNDLGLEVASSKSMKSQVKSLSFEDVLMEDSISYKVVVVSSVEEKSKSEFDHHESVENDSQENFEIVDTSSVVSLPLECSDINQDCLKEFPKESIENKNISSKDAKESRHTFGSLEDLSSKESNRLIENQLEDHSSNVSSTLTDKTLDCLTEDLESINPMVEKIHSPVSSKDSNDTDLDSYSYFNREQSIEAEDFVHDFDEGSSNSNTCRDFLSHGPPVDSSPFFRPEDTFGFTVNVKGILSPVDSAPESGFVSLKDSSHSEGTSESGSVVPFSKSKDSLEMTDSEKNQGADNLSDDFDSAIADGDQIKNDACSVNGSLANINQASDLLFGTKKFDVDTVSIPSHQIVGTSLIKNQRSKYFRNASLDPETLDSQRTRDLDLTLPDCEQIVDKKESKQEVPKPGSDDSESVVLKTSDSVSSSDTIISKASFEEHNKLVRGEHLRSTSSHEVSLESDRSMSVQEPDGIAIASELNGSSNSKYDILGTEDMDDLTEEDMANPDLSTLKNSKKFAKDMIKKSLPNSFIESDRNEDDGKTSEGSIMPILGGIDNNINQDMKSNYNEIVVTNTSLDTNILSDCSADEHRDKMEKQEYILDSNEKQIENEFIKKITAVDKQQGTETVDDKSSSEENDIFPYRNEIQLLGSYMKCESSSENDTLLETAPVNSDGRKTEEIDVGIDRETGKSFSSVVSHCHSEGNLGKSRSFVPVDTKYKTKSVTSFHNSSSSSEIISDRASLKSQDSLDTFAHFEHISAQPKPRTKYRKKILSVDVKGSTKELNDPLHRSVTLPNDDLSISQDSNKKTKEVKTKKKKKDSGTTADKKSTLASIKDFLRLTKFKESNTTKTSSPSLFKKLEMKAKGTSQIESRDISPICTPLIPVIKESIKTKITPEETNDKTHRSSFAAREGVTKMGIKSTLHRSNALASSAYIPEAESDLSPLATPKTSPHHRKPSINGSPKLYRHVLMRNLSSSQESLEFPNNISSSIGQCGKDVDSGSDIISPVPVMGTRALKTPKSFSVTIGFKPQVGGDSPNENRTMSVGENLHKVSRSSSRRRTSSATSTLTKRSSSMEILVYGKIREHNSGGRRRSSSGGSREGSFRLHREISVETLVEIPEGGPPLLLNENENYQDYLHRVQANRDSKQSSSWSLCDNDGSLSDSLNSHVSQPVSYCPSNSSLGQKYGSAHNTYFSELNSDVSNSNPNLSRVSSPFVRGIPSSSSFTSSPYRRPLSATFSSSPAKRGFASQGKKITSPTNESCPESSLMEEDELEPNRINLDLETERSPNVLVYTANNIEYFESVKSTLQNSFNADRYLVYHLTDEMALKSPWAGSTTLLVVCGDVPTHVSTFFIRYLLEGGRVLSICSDFLNVAVPLFGTVEVQEASVVSMSYNKWKSVQLLHHQHCFHSSPKHKRFSRDLENKNSKSNSAVSVEPTYVEITDEYGTQHRLDLKVLARDDTWGAPSLLVADVNESTGKALFSQVHLEKDPNQSITIDLKEEQLKKCNEDRLEILKDLLNTHLGLDISQAETREPIDYTPAYLLGRHELKQQFMEDLKMYSDNNELERTNLSLQFLKEKSTSMKPSDKLLPVLMNAYPNNFSTVKYFETLQTVKVGRLVIYCDAINSTMDVLSGKMPLIHGTVVLSTRQLGGQGRHGNLWLSLLGCVMFSIQLHIPVASNLGQSVPFLQHLCSMAAVLAVKGQKGYEDLPLTLKWPNDIYVGSQSKIGGILVQASTFKGNVVANIGCGINLSNSNPTSCINDIIQNFNRENDTCLKEIDREVFLANYLNELEKLLDEVQANGTQSIIPDYYKYWLHGDESVIVKNEVGHSERANIVGINQYGFLVARLNSEEEINLHPDGNSFNMMEGLIYSKSTT